MSDSDAMSDPNLITPDDDDAAERRIRRCATVWRWALAVGIILGWEILTRLKIIDPYYFSSPVTIAKTAYVAATQGTLFVDIGYTSASTIVGFIIGVVGGALIGLSTS
jgi:NitT/TauT family transport system permease protein